MTKNLLNQFIAEALIYELAEKGISQKEAAQRMDVSESFLSDVLYGRKKFNVKHLYLLMERINICPTFIFPNEETFNLIKGALNYQNYNDFIADLNLNLYSKEGENE